MLGNLDSTSAVEGLAVARESKCTIPRPHLERRHEPARVDRGARQLTGHHGKTNRRRLKRRLSSIYLTSKSPSSSRSRHPGARPGGWYSQLPMKIIQTLRTWPSISTSIGRARRTKRVAATTRAAHLPSLGSNSFAADSTRSGVASEARRVQERPSVDGADIDRRELPFLESHESSSAHRRVRCRGRSGSVSRRETRREDDASQVPARPRALIDPSPPTIPHGAARSSADRPMRHRDRCRRSCGSSCAPGSCTLQVVDEIVVGRAGAGVDDDRRRRGHRCPRRGVEPRHELGAPRPAGSA